MILPCLDQLQYRKHSNNSRRLKMPQCKFCNSQINWSSNNGKNIPVNLDGSNHRCQANNKQNTGQTIIQEDEISQLVKLFEKVLRSK